MPPRADSAALSIAASSNTSTRRGCFFCVAAGDIRVRWTSRLVVDVGSSPADNRQGGSQRVQCSKSRHVHGPGRSGARHEERRTQLSGDAHASSQPLLNPVYCQTSAIKMDLHAFGLLGTIHALSVSRASIAEGLPHAAATHLNL